MNANARGRRLVAAAVLTALLAGAPSRADQTSPGTDPGGCEAVRTYNSTGNKIWVTIYDLAKTTHLDYGWVEPCSVRVWRAGGYSCGSFYHVRAEVKPYDVNGPNVFDTNVEINPQADQYSSFGVTLVRNGTSDKYYFDHGNTAGCTPTGMTHCCKNYVAPQGTPQAAPPPAAPKPPVQVQFTYENATDRQVLVTLYAPDNPKIRAECVKPRETAAWTVSGEFTYRVRSAIYSKTCADPKPDFTQVGETAEKDGKASTRFYFDSTGKHWAYGPLAPAAAPPAAK